jgi:hypothetical protein
MGVLAWLFSLDARRLGGGMIEIPVELIGEGWRQEWLRKNVLERTTVDPMVDPPCAPIVGFHGTRGDDACSCPYSGCQGMSPTMLYTCNGRLFSRSPPLSRSHHRNVYQPDGHAHGLRKSKPGAGKCASDLRRAPLSAPRDAAAGHISRHSPRREDGQHVDLGALEIRGLLDRAREAGRQPGGKPLPRPGLDVSAIGPLLGAAVRRGLGRARATGRLGMRTTRGKKLRIDNLPHASLFFLYLHGFFPDLRFAYTHQKIPALADTSHCF